MVEQRNHNPWVGGPNPSAATRINKRPDGSFFYSVRRGGEGQPDGGPTRRQKADGRMPVRNANLPRGMKRSGINPSAATKISRFSGIFYFVKNFRFRPNLSVLADVFTYTGHNPGHRKICLHA